MKRVRGIWGMHCWNGLSEDQKKRLIEHGNLEIGYQPEGSCPRGADCGIETKDDVAPGPRFYCYPCGTLELAGRIGREA